MYISDKRFLAMILRAISTSKVSNPSLSLLSLKNQATDTKLFFTDSLKKNPFTTRSISSQTPHNNLSISNRAMSRSRRLQNKNAELSAPNDLLASRILYSTRHETAKLSGLFLIKREIDFLQADDAISFNIPRGLISPQSGPNAGH